MKHHMLNFSVDMRDNRTDEVFRFRMDASVGWSDGPNGAIWVFRNTMCDCQMFPYFEALRRYNQDKAACEAKGMEYKRPLYGENQVTPDHSGYINRPGWRASYPFQCDHKMPPKKFTALRAHLADGRVIDLQSGAEISAAA